MVPTEPITKPLLKITEGLSIKYLVLHTAVFKGKVILAYLLVHCRKKIIGPWVDLWLTPHNGAGDASEHGVRCVGGTNDPDLEVITNYGKIPKWRRRQDRYMPTWEGWAGWQVKRHAMLSDIR